MSVNAPATNPPVQDSAVAIVSLRIRHKSSSARERARASLPLMSVAPPFIVPWKAYRGAGGCGDAFLAPGKAEPFAGGRFHRDTGDVEAGDLGDPRPHDVAQWADFRPLADHRHFEIGDAAAARGDAIDGVFQEAIGGRTFPLHVAGREMRTDIAIRERAENGVDQRVQSDIAVGMCEKAARMWDANTAEHQMIA